MPEPDKPHYLRFNARERTPLRVAVFDCESRWHTEDRREIHELRCWSARLMRRKNLEPDKPRFEDADGITGEQLAALVWKWSSHKAPLWMFAHNLTVDLSLTRLPLLLLEAGWTIGRNALASDQPWAHLKRRSRSLWLVDSGSWLPVSVDTLATLLGLTKPKLPPEDAALDAWRYRCQQDVAITALAICQLMESWDERKQGWWSFTGPATAWNGMLHARVGGWCVIDPDPVARAFERQAIYSGRRDVWRVGKLPPGPYAEIDARLAHLSICINEQLPVRRGPRFESLPVEHPHLDSRVYGVLAECVVAVERPRYPLRWHGVTLHPVGTFRTVLAGPEIVEARKRSELRAIGPGYPYQLADAMLSWAQETYWLLTRPPGEVDPMLQTFLTMASRAVPGRWAMRVTRRLLEGASAEKGWALERAYFVQQACLGYVAHLGGRWQELVRDQDGDDAFPAVLAFIEAHDRLRLARAVDALGEDTVLAVNTDSMLAVEPQDGALARINAATAPLEYRVKARARKVVVKSPQHVRLDGKPHYAGIPRTALEVDPEVFRFWTWPGLASQMERGDPRGYVRERQTVNLTAVPVSRWVYGCGCCEPVRAALAPGSATQLLPPSRQASCAHLGTLADSQHPILRGLRS